jgi:hypothetical protein
VSCAPSGDEGPTSYIEIKKTRNKLSETKGNNKKTNEQNKNKIKNKNKNKNKHKHKHKKKKKQTTTTTQKQNLTAAARDLGTVPRG